MSIIRENLMNRPDYSPYCGNSKCPQMPRTQWTGKQFKCPCCGWESQFDSEFINEYKRKWQK